MHSKCPHAATSVQVNAFEIIKGGALEKIRDRPTYAARSIHLHCVQNWIAMRGRFTRSMAVALAAEPEPGVSDCGAEACERLASIGGVGSVMTILCRDGGTRYTVT